jgi:predicted MPP superfamily phosphohydrolase
MKDSRDHASLIRLMFRWGAAAGGAAAAYMAFEAQWVRCTQADLAVPDLPPAWSGLTILHLSDVHAGVFPSNERSLRKAVEWALPLEPDLVVLSGDVLGDPRYAEPCLRLLARLNPPLGKFAVTGNHEFGIAKGPLARARSTDHLWEQAGVTLLRDRCVSLPERNHSIVALCGADYLTGGFDLVDVAALLANDAFPILLTHEPPAPDSPLSRVFPLVFAGHTHGGQLRIPTGRGLRPLNGENDVHLGGVYEWGRGVLVVSQGIGTSFVPLRLLTRPEATLWRLV